MDMKTFLQDYAGWLQSGQWPRRKEFENVGLVAYGRFVPGQSFLDSYRLREKFLKEFGFAVLCAEAVELLRPHCPWLEVGAGSGAWVRGLQAAGLAVIGTDPKNDEHWGFQYEKHAPLAPLPAADAIKWAPDRNVLCVWPTLGQSWAAEAIAVITPGRFLALVHEEEGGCVGDDAMYEILSTSYTQVAEEALPCFPGIHDHLTLYQRK